MVASGYVPSPPPFFIAVSHWNSSSAFFGLPSNPPLAAQSAR